MTVNDKSLGKFIRRIRKHRKLKQTDVARAIGRTSAFVCDLEKGRRGANLSENVAMQLAEYLNVPYSQLISYHPKLAPTTNTDKLNQVYRAIRHKGRAKRIMLSLEGIQKVFSELLEEVNARKVTPRAENAIYKGSELAKELQNALTVG